MSVLPQPCPSASPAATTACLTWDTSNAGGQATHTRNQATYTRSQATHTRSQATYARSQATHARSQATCPCKKKEKDWGSSSGRGTGAARGLGWPEVQVGGRWERWWEGWWMDGGGGSGWVGGW